METTATRRGRRHGNARALLVLGVCAVASLGIWLWTWQGDETQAPARATIVPADPAPATRDELTSAPQSDVGPIVASTTNPAPGVVPPADVTHIAQTNYDPDEFDFDPEGERMSRKVPVVTGIVVHEDGRPAVAATVIVGQMTTTTADDGRFELPIRWPPKPRDSLLAALRGYMSVIVPNFGELLQRGARPPPDQRLVLGGIPLTIAGRVLLLNDLPAADWCVGLLDASKTAPGWQPMSAESLAAGVNGLYTTTNSQGEFEIGGLYPRRYTLNYWSEQSLMSLVSEPIDAGTSDVLLRISSGLLWPRLEGRVVARDGAGVGGVRVTTYLRTPAKRVMGVRAVTDDRGEFVLENVAHQSTYLALEGGRVAAPIVELDGVDPTQPLEIRAKRLCQFTFESTASPDARPDALRILDDTGQLQGADQIRHALADSGESESSIADYMERWSNAALDNGKSELLASTEGSKTFILMRRNKETARFSVTLVPGKVQVIRR